MQGPNSPTVYGDGLERKRTMNKRERAATLTLRQKQRPRPSHTKMTPLTRGTPAQRLECAIELSDFCLALHEAQKRRK
jgi:hypothetical protein